MKYNHLLLCILAILISSCVFSPDKENFVEVDQEVEPLEITNQSLDLEADTLYVWKSTRFNFDFRSSKQEIRLVVVTVGGETRQSGATSGSFDVNPDTFPEGISQVEIKLYTGSGTGSMADRMGVEGLEFRKTWVLVVEKIKPPVISISSVIENGYLKFTWNKLNKEYIKYFTISITRDGFSDFDQPLIMDTNIDSYVDSMYVGGKIKFKLGVTYENLQGYYEGVTREYEFNYPIALSFKEDMEHLTISWTRNPFHYTPYFSLSGNLPIQLINYYKPLNASDTSYTIPSPGLGDPLNYKVSFKPEGASEYWRKSDHLSTYAIGIKDSMEHENVEYNPALKSYYFKNEYLIRTADPGFLPQNIYNSGLTNDRFALAFSADNEKLYTTANGRLITLNASGLNVLDSKSIYSLLPNYWRTLALKSLDEQTVLIGYQTQEEERIVLFNPLSGTVIHQTKPVPHNHIYNLNSMNVSPDGKYAAITNETGLYLYDIVDHTNLTLRHQDSQSCINALFDPQHPERLIINRNDHIEVFNCSTLQVDRTIGLSASPINFDPQTHYLLMGSELKNKIYVYDFENDMKKFEISFHGFSSEFKLINNIIFVNAGYHLDISSYVD